MNVNKGKYGLEVSVYQEHKHIRFIYSHGQLNHHIPTGYDMRMHRGKERKNKID